jgi:hypothetical protein
MRAGNVEKLDIVEDENSDAARGFHAPQSGAGRAWPKGQSTDDFGHHFPGAPSPSSSSGLTGSISWA